MDVRTNFFYKRVNMTPERQKIADVMNIDEEGLTPRAFAVLLQIHDGQTLSDIDTEWVTQWADWEMARYGNYDLFALVDGKPVLTLRGIQIAEAADRGDADTIYRLTTRPDW